MTKAYTTISTRSPQDDLSGRLRDLSRKYQRIVNAVGDARIRLVNRVAQDVSRGKGDEWLARNPLS
jgi:hypothetical protein